ncbi:MAG: hypothetical protein EOO55_01320 [Hymenobacter sp.]|nr:MAG: hypothetical protein EOO55_01320 [Hymenobacter sp.]
MGLLSQVKRILGFTEKVAPAEKPTASETPTIEREFQSQLQEQITLHFPDLYIEAVDGQLLLGNGQLSLEGRVFEKTVHSHAVVLGLRLCLTHQRFFPTGVVDCLAGIGSTDAEAIEAGARNYVGSVFSVVVEALLGGYEPSLDSRTQDGALWHTMLGPLHVQGLWAKYSDELDDNHFLELLKPHLLPRFVLQPFHWLKLYVSRQPSGAFFGDCLFDNEPWPEGLAILEEAAAQWPEKGVFAGQKQFIMFRNCPATGLAEECTHSVRPDADDADRHL